MFTAAADSPSPVSKPVTPDDYDLVRRAVEFISKAWRRQPSVEAIADHLGIGEPQLHALFRRWAGLSPKAFLQAVTLDRARVLLKSDASILEASLELGLSGPGRLHDLFVTHEAMSPGAYKSGGAGVVITHGFHASPFGDALVMTTAHGLAGLAFADGNRAATLADMTRRWPRATYREDVGATAPIAARVFDANAWSAERPLNVVMIGTDFEVRVWRTLMAIPMGRTATYGEVAERIGAPKAARAVGAAVGRNPISFVVPCHRVLGAGGALTGYHWGVTRKQCILGWEIGRLLASAPQIA